MTTIKLRSHVDHDGILRLQIPSSLQDMDVDVTITLSAVTPESKQNSVWSEGFFEEVIGGWQGEPLVRPAQGSYPTRDEL